MQKFFNRVYSADGCLFLCNIGYFTDKIWLMRVWVCTSACGNRFSLTGIKEISKDLSAYLTQFNQMLDGTLWIMLDI